MVFKNLLIRALCLCLIVIISSACNEDGVYDKKRLKGSNVAESTDEKVDPRPTVEPTKGPTTKPITVLKPTLEIDIEPSPVPIVEPIPVPIVEPTTTVKLKNVREEFIQNSSEDGGKADILWVIDNSGSMRDDQRALAKNFEFFIHGFIQKDVDFKMAITTTDTTRKYDGRVTCGTYSILDYTAVCDQRKDVPSSSELIELLSSPAAESNFDLFINNFKHYIDVGEMGSSNEKGLDATKMFIDRYANSFLRDNAYFVVIIVSDEEDRSQHLVNHYVKFIQDTKINAGSAKIYSIISYKNKDNSSTGMRYMEASKLTGGTHADIRKNFHMTLSDIGGHIVALLKSFSLSEVPYQDKVTVKVDGKVKKKGWTFDPLSRSVKFADDSIPAEGLLIEISYQVEVSI